MRFWWTKTKPDQEERIRALEKRLEEIEFEWKGWYDKYRRLYARLVKREASEAADSSPINRGGVEPQLQLVDEQQLTGEAAQIQQEILAMRKGGNRGL